jgi:hypothetical protein
MTSIHPGPQKGTEMQLTRVIVQFRIGFRQGSPLDRHAQRRAIAEGRGALLRELAGLSHRAVHVPSGRPFVVLEVAPSAVRLLETSARVVRVEVLPLRESSDRTTPVNESPRSTTRARRPQRVSFREVG